MAEIVATLGVVGAILLSGRIAWCPKPRLRAVVGLAMAAAVVLLSAGFARIQAFLLVDAVGTSVGVIWLLGRRQARAKARMTAQSVQAVCAELAEDLRVGRAPRVAIIEATARWPPLRSVAIAADIGHDVPGALRDLAELPGAAGLRDVAAAWQVSSQAGSRLADALDQVARLLAARERRTRLVEAELAAARATGGVVSGLPALVLGMGAGAGTDPWAFFVSGLGPAVLGIALILMLIGWTWLDALASRAAVP